jgi:UDP-N-acetylmuramoyl-L-alanyl-D-glutamate--2,6-diaminopimelate ligase
MHGYHRFLAWLGAVWYGYPSRQMLVIGITGTKGKSSTCEYVNAIFEAAGYHTVLASTIRTKVAGYSEPNLTRMTMQGRFFLQHLLRQGLDAGCTVAIIEMSSEGARQHRHRSIDLDALIFLNLAPEHIESHGSFEAYGDAKFELGLGLARSRKRPRCIIANADDAASGRYLSLPVEHSLPYSLAAVEPWEAREDGGSFTFDSHRISIHLPGTFSISNAAAAATCTRALGISTEAIARGLDALHSIPGRDERIDEGQPFLVVVDNAHTIDSQKALYQAFADRRKICVLGSCGGGRDMWVRPEKGRVAEEHCAHVILTNEDPYDEDPRSIIDMIAHGMQRTPDIVVDRREAIAKAFHMAQPGDAVLLIGKGTDPSIKGMGGSSTPWSDARVAREELEKLLTKHV